MATGISNPETAEDLLGVFRSGERLAALLDLAAVLGADDRAGKPLPNEENRGG